MTQEQIEAVRAGLPDRLMELADKLTDKHAGLLRHSATAMRDLTKANEELRAEVREQALQFLATDGQAIDLMAQLAEARATIDRLQIDIAGYRDLAKRNNDLAKMYHAQANEFRAKYVIASGDPA